MNRKLNGAGEQLTSAELHQRQLEQSPAPAPSLIAAGVSDIQNLGALFRIAEAVGCIELILIDSPLVDSLKLRRVSRHTAQQVPHRCLSADDFLATLTDFPPLVALEITSASTDLFCTPLPHEMALVVGAERHGIPPAILKHCQFAVHIPMFGLNSSMNVAVAAGIVLYEWHRRFRTEKQSGDHWLKPSGEIDAP